MTGKGRIGIRDICLMAVLGATMYASQVALAFLPNIELVSLLTILFTLVFKKKIIGILGVFLVIETFTYGINTWTIMYMYVWPILALIAYLFRKVDKPVIWAVISGAYGLSFGFLCSIVYLFIGGPGGFWAYFLNGLTFDLIHCLGNFTVTFFLYRALRKALEKLNRIFLRA
ncbi:MAG: hypothetical protein Q4C42_11940 [Clostridia bacterium]|nr:hypothetical protein [Clostridia bacterium]